VLDRHHERVGVDAVDDAADDVGGLVRKNGDDSHLDLVIRLQRERPRKARTGTRPEDW